MSTDNARQEHSLLRVLGTSIVILLVACCVGYALVRVTVVTADARGESKREKTVLDERVATAREIRAILSRPQPQIKPLPPITAKLAKPYPANQQTKVVGMDGRKPIRLPKEARDAFAMESRGQFQGNYDRAGSGGW